MGTGRAPTHPRRQRSGARCPVGLLALEIPDEAGIQGRRRALPSASGPAPATTTTPPPRAQRALQIANGSVAIRNTRFGEQSSVQP